MSLEFRVTTALLMIVTYYRVEGLLRPRTRQVCYPPWGCFSNAPPFDGPTAMLPRNPGQVNISFLLFRQGMATRRLLPGQTDGLDLSLPTKVIIHGYMDRATNQWVSNMASGLLGRGPANVIAVDWSNGAMKWNYYQAVANARLVAVVTADLLSRLESLGANRQHYHLIGHSLGAHLAGYVGGQLSNISRITGLDPAGPSFYDAPPGAALDPSDAIFVDVIHTDATPLLNLGLGLKKPIGTADYYPNGGQNQPGCPIRLQDKLLQALFNPAAAFATIGCSHLRVLDFFTESISSSCRFQVRRCSSENALSATSCQPCQPNVCGVMGYEADVTNSSGIFFVETNSRAPFCIN